MGCLSGLAGSSLAPETKGSENILSKLRASFWILPPEPQLKGEKSGGADAPPRHLASNQARAPV
jgi:hypothetical protein